MQKLQPEISLKRAYDTPDESDGIRVLVDRLWPRGVRKADLKIAIWLKNVAPSTDLRKWFAHDPAKWLVFQERYLDELQHGDNDLCTLLNLARSGKITLVYAAHDEVHNHALVLREFLRRTLAQSKNIQSSNLQNAPENSV